MFTYTIVALVFKQDSQDTAVSAFDALVSLPANEQEGLLSTAVVQRDPYGQAKFVHGRYWSKDKSSPQGGLLGLIIGLLFAGPVVSLIGGLGLGAFLGDTFGRGLSQTFITNLQNDLEPSDTALMLLLSHPNESLLTNHLASRAHLHRTELNIEINSGLRQALAGYVE